VIVLWWIYVKLLLIYRTILLYMSTCKGASSRTLARGGLHFGDLKRMHMAQELVPPIRSYKT
jgi:hypothetical protein